MIPLGEWLPDQPAHANQGATVAKNVIPALQGYVPLPAAADLSTAADAYLRNGYGFKDKALASKVFVGNGTKLYQYNDATFALDNISKSGNYTLADIDRWNFVQFGDRVIASGGHSTDLQSFTIGTSSLFADLVTGIQAKHLAVVGNFVVGGNMKESTTVTPWRVRWCAFEDPTDWTIDPSATQADSQDIPDVGHVTGLVGGEVGYVFCDYAIVRMSYVGYPAIFQFDRLENARGCPYSGSIARLGPFAFYYSHDGFYLLNGEQSIPIGDQKVDRWFQDELDASYSHRITAAADPKRKIIVWSFPSTESGDGSPDRVLIYNYALKRWSYGALSLDSVFPMITPGTSLEALDSISASIDALGISLDSPAFVGGDILMGVGNASKLATLDGDPLSGVVETGEFGDMNHHLLRRVYPYVEGEAGTTVTVQCAVRNKSTDPITFASAVSAGDTGWAATRCSGRLQRVRLNLSGPWAKAQGIDADIAKRGVR